MDKLELSFQILKEVLSHKSDNKQNLVEKTQEILNAFEKIYNQISSLEDKKNELSVNQNSRTNLKQIFQEALKNDSYESFRQLITNELLEKPHLFEMKDHGIEVAEQFKVAINQNSFLAFSEAIKPISTKILSIDCAFGICPYCSITMAAESETYEQFKDKLSNSFSEN